MKKPLLFSAFLIICNIAFAQLTVKPTLTGADSYIYVKDQVLYVEKAINLTSNTDPTIQASIYLRGNGQLIQGGTASLNSGNGYLSVQQNTLITNAWAYYDWCSPIGNPIPVGGGTPYVPGNSLFGIETIYEDKNFVPGAGTAALKSLNISTKEGYNEPALTISRRWIYVLKDPGTENENNYTRINATNGAPAGYGFTMKGVKNGTLAAPEPPAPYGHDQLYEFRGRPNNGDFTINIREPEGGGPVNPSNVNARMVLSGNPFPSALDLKAFFDDPVNNALGAIYFYDEDRSKMSHNYSGKPFGYAVWISGGPGNTNGVYTQATFFIWNSAGTHSGTGVGFGRLDGPKRYAPIGQGFRLVGNIAGNVTIKNSYRAFIPEGISSIFFRPTADNSNEEESTTQNDANGGTSIYSDDVDLRPSQMRLYVVFDEALTRDMLLILSDETTDGYDRGYDGLSPGGMKSDAFFPIEDNNEIRPYVIQGTNYDINKQIPITFKLHQTSVISVRAVEEINQPYERAYLYDKLEDKYRTLSLNEEAGFSLPAGIYENRFYIVFRNLNLRSDVPQDEMLAKEAVRKSVNFFQNNPAQQLEVKNPDGYTFKSAAVYDMAGKLVINEKNLGDDTKYTFYTGNLSDGVYLIKLTTSEDIIIDYKAIVHNK